MLKTNFRLLVRSLWRNKLFSLLNISGLAVGIAVSLLIFLLIRYELSIDRQHGNRDRIYRVVSTETYRNGAMDYDGCAPTPLADALRHEFPQVEQVAAVIRTGMRQYTLPDSGSGPEKQVRVSDVYFADPALFSIFDLPWLSGNPATALREAYTVAISRQVADSWFGHWQNAVGKTILQGEERRPFRITGVLEDAPSNTDISIQMAVSYATFRAWNEKELADPMAWDNFSTSSQCYFLLGKGQRIESMEAMLPQFVATHFTPLAAQSDSRDSCYFQPLREMHFDTALARPGRAGWSYTELWSMGLIGIFLLTVACINFVNLSTAQSMKRSKEVGIRKVLGSNRGQLLASFLWETALLVCLALALACILTELALPSLRLILEKPVVLDHSWSTILFLLGTGVLVTFSAGAYPGIVLSRYKPVAVFKHKLSARSAGGISLRRGLLVMQFAIAQLLIIGTVVIVRQVDFFRSRPMGFDRNAIALINLPNTKDGILKNDYFRSRVLQMPGILAASLCNDPPSTSGINEGYFALEGHDRPEGFELVRRAGDTAYLSLFGMGLVAGRTPYASDTAREEEALLNETAVRMLGVKSAADLLGKHMRLGSTQKKIAIVGIVKDFNNTSLRDEIKPLAILSSADRYGKLAVKLDPSRIKGALSRLQAVYSEIYGGAFFDASFFDDVVNDFYHEEAIASILFKLFAALAIFISCLGLYGLVSFMAVQKTKEVGVRKVLGASVTDIVYMFSKEFTLVIGVAFVIAAPAGYYFMQHWLSGYQYHMRLGWEVFAIAILSSVTIAWITVGYKAVKAALANPVKSLRTE